ncbi:MAG: UDP-3-O-(3-hydroxymyristoyl)glucosamine N-acyltransferase [Candidatus Rokubacteria bacterium]|nr:UDP-3-O-(3-hydroxymyristoyl)glucosamine N-acyltransferase [Candidatus Rokubacteria bacterium]
MSGWSLGELARLVGGELRGDPAMPIRGIAGLDRAQPGDLSFIAAARSRRDAERSRASAFLVPHDVDLPAFAVIRVAHPYLAVATLLRVFHPEPAPLPGIHRTAIVAESARVAADATVLEFVIVGAGSRVESRAVLHPHVVVGEQCRVGEGSVLHPHVVLRADVDVGRRVVIHSGAVLGADGFGYAFDGTRHQKIPQVGRVVIEDDVEIGANVTIDRAMLGETVIGRGTKIDNLVQIGHNTVVGMDSIIVAQTGISGSCRVGNRVVLGGQVGIVDHVAIGDGAQVGSQSGVHRDVPTGAAVLGYPAMPAGQARRVMAALPRLPELLRALRAVERRLGEIERRLGEQR